jgi:hypothetical protein
VPTGHDDRVKHRTLIGPDGHSGQIDEVEDVGVDELGRKIEGQDVEASGWQVSLDGEERNFGRPHGSLHVHPGCIRAFGGRVGALVQDLVEDLEALIGQADLVGVGVDK